VQMPVLDGYEATKAIRKDEDPNVKEVLVIAMTASAIRGDREKCLEAGMNDYLAKPVRQTVLKTMIDEYLAKPVDELMKGGEPVRGTYASVYVNGVVNDKREQPDNRTTTSKDDGAEIKGAKSSVDVKSPTTNGIMSSDSEPKETNPLAALKSPTFNGAPQKPIIKNWTKNRSVDISNTSNGSPSSTVRNATLQEPEESEELSLKTIRKLVPPSSNHKPPDEECENGTKS
jgi:Response regulator receiver domain